MKFTISIWCEDCREVGDTMGCFDGGSEVWEEDCADYDDAVKVAEKSVSGCPLWEYSIVETNNFLK